MNILEKVKNWTADIFSEIGVLSHDFEEYMRVALHTTETFADLLKKDAGQITTSISELSQFLVFDKCELDVENILKEGLVKVIKKMTTNADILNKDVDSMINAFLLELKKDTELVQKTKLMRIAQELVAFMDGNKKFQHIYDYLVQKYYTHKFLND